MKKVNLIIYTLMYAISSGILIIAIHLNSAYKKFTSQSNTLLMMAEDLDIRWFLSYYSVGLILAAILLIIFTTYFIISNRKETF